MGIYSIAKCTLKEIETVIDISKKTFYETFAGENTKEDMEEYIKENLSYNRIKSEIENSDSKFYIVKNNDEVLAYMKINFNKAQTEKNHDNTLEIQRIYVLQKYKGKKIGKMLIEEAKKIAMENSLRYIWLGVWEKNYSAIKFYEKQGFKNFDTHIFKLGNDEQIDNLMKFSL